MEVDLNLSPFKEYQDLCMCLFYNEFIPLVSFLPVHKFFLRRKYIAGFIQSLKMLAVNSDSDLALRRQSPCFHHLLFSDVHISHHISGKHFTAQCSSEALSSVPLKEGGVSCHLLLLSATNLLLHSGKL